MAGRQNADRFVAVRKHHGEPRADIDGRHAVLVRERRRHRLEQRVIAPPPPTPAARTPTPPTPAPAAARPAPSPPPAPSRPGSKAPPSADDPGSPAPARATTSSSTPRPATAAPPPRRPAEPASSPPAPRPRPAHRATHRRRPVLRRSHRSRTPSHVAPSVAAVLPGPRRLRRPLRRGPAGLGAVTTRHRRGQCRERAAAAQQPASRVPPTSARAAPSWPSPITAASPSAPAEGRLEHFPSRLARK